jgi:hypothetical protein
LETRWYNPIAGVTEETGYSSALYPDNIFLVQPRMRPERTYEQAVRVQYAELLGDKLADLSDLGCLATSALATASQSTWLTTKEEINYQSSTFATQRIVDIVEPPEGSYDEWHRVWLPPITQASPSPRWKIASFLYLGQWQPYRLRGMSLIDVWGSEMLSINVGNGGLLVTSSGLDAHFLVLPGANGIYDTPAQDVDPSNPSSLQGDDKWAYLDNINWTHWR